MSRFSMSKLSNITALLDMGARERDIYTRVIVKGGKVSITFDAYATWIVRQVGHPNPILGMADTLMDALQMAYDTLDLEQQQNEQDEAPPTTRDRYNVIETCARHTRTEEAKGRLLGGRKHKDMA